MNKKFLLCFLAAIITCTNLVARQLDSDQALNIALSKLSKSTNIQYAKTRSSVSLKLTHTELNPNSVPLYYVYDMPQGGFLIAGADSRSQGLLGYTDNGSFSDAQNNPSFLGWLKECQNALSWLSNQPETPSHSIKSTTRTSDESTLASSVAPLLGNIKWDQDGPYNLLCPSVEDAKGNSVLCPTGCVATAVAQVMKYYNWPDCGEGSHTNAKLETQYADFSQSVYDWDNMIDNYEVVEYTETQANAVAKLMADVGCAVDMEYLDGGSQAYDEDLLLAIATYFKYDKGIEIHYRYQYNSEEWNALLRKELSEQRPVYMGGNADLSGGHAFVLDGYDSNGLYHVNWGWGGMSDGYFNIDYMNPYNQGIGGAAGGFSYYQAILINIKPDKTCTSVAKSRLYMYDNITYQEEKFHYGVKNIGLADFNGYLGFVLKDENNEVVDEYWKSLAEDPLLYLSKYGDYGGAEMEYSIPASCSIKTGYSVTPVYKFSKDQEAIPLMGQLSGAHQLIATVVGDEITWTADQIAMLQLLDVIVNPIHIGDIPKATVTVKNISNIEYNDGIYGKIVKTDETGNYVFYGEGVAQLFLQPGDSTTVVVECSSYYYNEKDGEELWLSYQDLEAGEYDLYLYFYQGYRRVFFSDPLALKVGEPYASDISYSDFAINDSVFVQGDKLVATFKATNNGDFEYKNYSFWVKKEGTKDWAACYSTSSVLIPEKDSVVVAITGSIFLEPGNYRGYFYGENYLTKDSFNFRVKDSSTAIDGIDETKPNNDNTLTLDLYGRKVDQIKPGQIYIRRGKKIIEKTN